jgi:hypothetical protein
MNGFRCLAVMGGVILLGTLLAGCSGTVGGRGGPGDGVSIPLIDEYVGDGGGSAKPWPGASAQPDQPDAMGTLLSFGRWPKTATVTAKNVNWFRVAGAKAAAVCVVTLQPTADEDADLFVMKGDASGFGGSGDDCLGYSRRTPDGGAPDPVHGFAPDWVAYEPGNTSGWPSAQVAVYGMHSGTAVKHFWVEADRASQLVVNGGGYTHTVEGGNSNWYYFAATSGLQYTVRLQSVTAGDPDSYVYGSTASQFKAKHTAAGGGDAVFTATETGRHYIRVFGEAPGDNTFHVLVRQP